MMASLRSLAVNTNDSRAILLFDFLNQFQFQLIENILRIDSQWSPCHHLSVKRFVIVLTYRHQHLVSKVIAHWLQKTVRRQCCYRFALHIPSEIKDKMFSSHIEKCVKNNLQTYLVKVKSETRDLFWKSKIFFLLWFVTCLITYLRWSSGMR